MANIYNFGAWSQRRTAPWETGTATGTAVQDPAHVGDIQGAFGTVRAAELDRSPTWPRYLMAASSYPNLGFDPCPGNLRGCQDVLLLARKADELHSRYLAAVQRADGQLEDVRNMAPSPPGRCAFLRRDAEAIYGNAVHGLSEFAHNKALLEFISTVANVGVTAAELLAFFPPMTPAFGPIAIAAAVAALGAEALLAGFNHGSWSAVALNAAAMAPDAGWMRTASKLADMYKLAGLFKESGLAGPMTQASTLTGLVIGKTVDVAPGMFRMIGDSLKNVRDWVSKIATSKAPWQEPADTATGQA